ncbi:MAG: DUF1302 domain-containing protein, partial [Pseudomonadota bacterium]
RDFRYSRLVLLAVAPLSFAAAVEAAEFKWGDAEVTFNTQLSVGASWRVDDVDPSLVTPGNTMGVGRASAGTTDDGNLNFDDGDIYSLIFKGVHDFEIRGENTGFFLRFKYWYDQELENGNRPHGNLLNGYVPDQELNDSAFDDFAKASGIELLDAFVYGNFLLGQRVPLDLRLGRQVLSWGESTFIQNGLNVINPIDVSAFRRPGAEVKEGLLPVTLFSASAGLTDALSVDVFYQLEWESTVIDGCGTYFSDVDVAAGGCDGVVLTNALPDQVSIANGLFIRRNPDNEPDDTGQYGVALRYFAEALNGSEFGLYYLNYHSRTPFFSGNTSSNVARGGPPGVPFIPGNPLGGNPSYTVEFPEDIETFGATFATNLAGFALSGEVSYRPEQPVQLNTNDLLAAAVGEAPYSPLTPRVFAAQPGSLVAGFDELPVTQAQFTVIKFYERVLGADRLSLAAEVGANFVGSLAPQERLRYGRSSTFGVAFQPIPVEALGIPIPGDFLTCEAGYQTPPGFPLNVTIAPPNSNPDNCVLDGFVTDDSWGYRFRASLTYNSAIAGVNLIPSVAWSHDVDGYSPNANFVEDRKALGLALGAEYLNRYTADLSYTRFSGGDFNTQRDRDFVSLSLSVEF